MVALRILSAGGLTCITSHVLGDEHLQERPQTARIKFASQPGGKRHELLHEAKQRLARIASPTSSPPDGLPPARLPRQPNF